MFCKYNFALIGEKADKKKPTKDKNSEDEDKKKDEAGKNEKEYKNDL